MKFKGYPQKNADRNRVFSTNGHRFSYRNAVLSTEK